MDDVNINQIYLGVEEVELDGDEWVKLNWISNRSDSNGNFQSPEIQKDSDNEVAHTTDYDNKESVTNAELEDISDGISVITESDTDTVNTNFFRICQINHKPCRPLQILETQKDLLNILIASVLGIIIGLALSHLFTIRETCSVSSGVDVESLKTASHNIVNTCKEMTDMKTMLNEIKTHTADKKITKQFLEQFFEITDSSNYKSNKPIILTKEFLNSTPYSLDQLQLSLHVLSSLASIYDNNSSLKNEINKTLDIVNSTKAFYDTLILFNNTQDGSAPILNFLQHNSDKIHNTSKFLLSNLIEKVSKVTSKIYNKYAKERHRLNKKLCYLKSILPDDNFLKQLTENNQLFKDYNKSCFSNYTSKSLDGNMTTKRNVKSIKEQIIKTDTVLHTKYDKKNTHDNIHDKIHDNRKSFLKNKRNKRENTDKSIKFLQNASHKIHNVSQLLVSKVAENINKLRYQLSKELHHLKNILPNNSEFIKQLTEDYEEDNKKSVKSCERKNDYLQSNVIPKNDISKNNFDNILMQLKNTCPLSTNYCPKFNINMSTFDTVSNHKTKNYIPKKHDTNSKKTVMDHGNSVKILPAEGKSRPNKKDNFKSNGSTKKTYNDKSNYERKDISSQNKIRNHISEHTDNYHEPKHSSFDSRTMKQDNRRYIITDRRSESKRYNEYRKQRQFDDSEWYFQRVRSRRNARRRAEYMFQQDAK